jgi:hypothetical protein
MVELRERGAGEGGAVDAVFFTPEGALAGSYAAARRAALAAFKAQQAGGA